MKVLFKKFRRLKFIYKFMYLFIGLLLLIATLYFSYNLLLLKGIENAIRIGIIILFSLIVFLYFFVSLLVLFTKKNKTFIFGSVFILILTVVLFILGNFINKTYGVLERMNEDSTVYSTSLIIMKDKNESDITTIGMINNETDIEGFVLAKKLLNKEKMEFKNIKEYTNYLDMLSDLYDGNIDSMLIGSNYSLNYSSYDKFANIHDDVKEIAYYSEKIKIENNDVQKKLTEPFSILLLGVDSKYNGLKSNASFNGDTIMLITFNPKTLNATVFSIPRDTYVPIACYGNTMSKINSSAGSGTSCIIDTVEELVGFNIDYYVKINFKGVVDLVDALDGVDVDVPIQFCEQDSNRNFDNQICLKKGLQTLDGEQALALARHRKTLLFGDFQRVQHQQLVVEAIMQKAKSIRSVNDFYDILDAVSINIETNMHTETMLDFYNVGKNILINSSIDSINIEKTYLTGSDSHVFIPSLNSDVYIFEYSKESLNEIVNAMKVDLGIEKPEMIKDFNFSVNELYEVPVIGKVHLSS